MATTFKDFSSHAPMLPTEQVDTVSKARGGHAAADMGMHPGHTPAKLGKAVQEGGGPAKDAISVKQVMPTKGKVVSPSKATQ
jgi:hypothetical protein